MKNNDERASGDIVFKDYIDLNAKMLRCMGLVVRVEGNKRDRKSKILERIPTFISNLTCVAFGISQLLWIIDIWGDDKDLVTQITTTGISNIVCICKGFRLAYCREDLQLMFEKLNDIWKRAQPRVEIKKHILKKADNSLLFCKWYLIMMVVLSFCFGVPPVKDFFLQYLAREELNHTYDYSKRVFLGRYPFEIKSTEIYFIVLLEEQYLLLFCSALYWVCCDTLFAQLTTFTSLQFEILYHDIETVVNLEKDESRLQTKVCDFIKIHQDLLRICQMIEYIFSPVIFTTMLFTSINICVNVFELREMISDGKFSDAVIHCFHLINILFQLLVYCVFAERLTQRTNTIANAMYNCIWTEKNVKLRVYLRIIIMKSQEPFYCTAYGFFTIGHDRITIVSFKVLLKTNIFNYVFQRLLVYIDDTSYRLAQRWAVLLNLLFCEYNYFYEFYKYAIIIRANKNLNIWGYRFYLFLPKLEAYSSLIKLKSLRILRTLRNAKLQLIVNRAMSFYMMLQTTS